MYIHCKTINDRQMGIELSRGWLLMLSWRQAVEITVWFNKLF